MGFREVCSSVVTNRGDLSVRVLNPRGVTVARWEAKGVQILPCEERGISRMMMWSRRIRFASGFLSALIIVVLALGAVSCRGSYPAQQGEKLPEWPQQNITLIVPFNPGGGYDITARIVAPFLEKYLPKRANVVVKNVPGAGGKIGVMELFNSKPDGHTLGVISPVALAPMQLTGELGSKDIRDLVWFGQLDWAPPLVAAGAKSQFKDPVKMKGQDVRFACTSATVFPTLVVAEALGARPKVILYDGTGEAAMAVMRGDADVISLLWTSLIKQVEASEGKLVPLFVAASKRVQQLPQVPSAKELGFNVEESVTGATHMIAGPPGMSGDLVTVVAGVVEKATNDSEFKDQMEKAGYPAVPMAKEEAQQFTQQVLQTTEKYKHLLEAASK